jgi:hypothetical protein
LLVFGQGVVDLVIIYGGSEREAVGDAGDGRCLVGQPFGRRR